MGIGIIGWHKDTNSEPNRAFQRTDDLRLSYGFFLFLSGGLSENSSQPSMTKPITTPVHGGHMEFVWFILIGLAAGWLAGQLMKGGGFGVIGDIIVGVIGALLGGFIFGTLGVSVGGGLFGSLIVATIGAIVLIFLLRLVKKA